MTIELFARRIHSAAPAPEFKSSYRFIIPGDPVPCGRPRVTSTGHSFMPQRTIDYERRVSSIGLQTIPRPFDGHVRVRLEFYMANKRRCDVDNLAKSILDGLNRIAFVDDSKINDLHVLKFLDRENPRAIVFIESME